MRYPEGENYPPTSDQNSLLGTGSPLALAHGMLQNSPLSPQFGQVNRGSHTVPLKNRLKKI